MAGKKYAEVDVYESKLRKVMERLDSALLHLYFHRH